MASTPLLEVRELRTRFRTAHGDVRAVDGVSFSVPAAGAVGIVGESGSGKTATALSILRLLSEGGRIDSGSVLLEGLDLLTLDERQMRDVRGNRVSMVFQEPMTSLNPVFSVGDQIAEAARLHQGLSRTAARAKALEMLRAVRIAAPETRLEQFPHQLSGGMRQRVMLAMALICEPRLLVADEPTTALDVTVQAQILELLRTLRRERQMAVLLITHDLGAVAELCDEVVVMYAGQVVESGPVVDVFTRPQHPYTAALLKAIPSPEARWAEGARGRLAAIGGQVPGPTERIAGCRFRPRCAFASPRCTAEEPLLEGERRQARCFHPVGERAA